ncbi:MAG: DUF4820 domain-containing protein [Armatimonadota bacterium]|nr:DUF4820 domain-containing protein [Armatimonadota bacterium]
MAKRISLFALLLLAAGILLSGCSGGGGSVPPPTNYVAGQLLVKYEGGPSSQAARAANARIGATVIDTFDSIGWALVRLPQWLSVPDAITLYEQQPGVLAAEPNYTDRSLA